MDISDFPKRTPPGNRYSLQLPDFSPCAAEQQRLSSRSDPIVRRTIDSEPTAPDCFSERFLLFSCSGGADRRAGPQRVALPERRMAVLRSALLVATAGLLIAADAPKTGDTKKELEKLQGKWVATAIVQNGLEVNAEQVKKTKLTLVIKGNKFTTKKPRSTDMGTFQIGKAKEPRAIDFIATSAEGQKETTLGIDEWDGEKLRIAADQKKRPIEFKSEKGGAMVVTFQRVTD